MAAATGKYIVLEGHDGTGKSSQMVALRSRLEDSGIEVLELYEPARNPADGVEEDSVIAAAIRNVIVDKNLPRDDTTTALLFSAARHELWTKTALPALESGKWVIASRNYLSTIAYQSIAGSAPLDLVMKLTRQATDDRYMNPDLTIVLDLDDAHEQERRLIKREKGHKDIFESKGEDYQSKVREGYRQVAKDMNLPIVSANQAIDAVTDEIWSHVERLINDTDGSLANHLMHLLDMSSQNEAQDLTT